MMSAKNVAAASQQKTALLWQWVAEASALRVCFGAPTASIGVAGGRTGTAVASPIAAAAAGVR
jgi:hypothetical protein